MSGSAQGRTSGIEVRSIDYVPLNERHGKLWHLGPLWFMSNAQIATLAVGLISITGGGNLLWSLLAIVAGSKVSTKLELLSSLVSKVDQLIVGGGIANTFIAAEGHAVGKSLYEADLVDTAKKIDADARARGAEIPLPTDVVVATAFAAD